MIYRRRRRWRAAELAISGPDNCLAGKVGFEHFPFSKWPLRQASNQSPAPLHRAYLSLHQVHRLDRCLLQDRAASPARDAGDGAWA